MRGKNATWWIAAVDVAALAVFWLYGVPTLRRPLDAFLVLLAVLAILTALAAGKGMVRGAAVIVLSTSVSLFALEMAQKYANILDIARISANTFRDIAGGYHWESDNPASWLAARNRALAAGVMADAGEFALPPPFSLEPPEGLPVNRKEMRKEYHRDGAHFVEYAGDLTPSLPGPPLGFVNRPANRFREYVQTAENRTIVHDGLNTIDGAGNRKTTGNPDGDVYIFTGCSFTYGMFLDDLQTMPHYFSQWFGFEKNVLNIAVSGYGPHNALMDFSMDVHPGAAGVDPSRVKGVYYGLINHHVERVKPPLLGKGAPYYVLENGRPEYRGPLDGLPRQPTRLERLWNGSRIYPVLAERMRNRFASGSLTPEWRLVVALLAELDRVCRERYRVPLTVVYWNEDAAVVDALAKANLDVVLVSGAFDDKWKEEKIKYFLYDYHPSAYANRMLAAHLAQRAAGGPRPERRK